MAELIPPNTRYRESFLAALAEFHAEGRSLNEDERRIGADFAGFVRALLARADRTTLRPGWVPDTVLWLVEGEHYVGRVSIRHELNDRLKQVGGHIGYNIRPAWRHRGYGTLALRLALPQARALGLRRVLITCDADNIPSRKIIEKNGGQFEKTITIKGDPIKKLHFWINLT